MTKRVAVLALTAVLAMPAAASAQSFGQFTGAQTLAAGTHLGGGYLTSSSSVLGLLAQLRMSFYPGVDFGFQGGFARQNYPGTDLKYQILQPTAEYPYSLSVGGGLGVESGDHWNVLSLGPSVVSSRSFPGNGELVFTPFVGAGLLFSNVNVGSLNESDVSIPFRIGSEVRFNPQISLTGELQLRLGDDFNDDVGFAVGINSPF